MLKSTFTKESSPDQVADDDVVNLKRLLVTAKQQYEKILQSLNNQLQAEINHNQSLQSELNQAQNLLQESKNTHEEEILALKKQQITLKEFLKKNQEEIKQLKEPLINQNNNIAQKERLDQLERVIPFLRERAEAANLETNQLRNDLEEAYKKISSLESELTLENHSSDILSFREQLQKADLQKKQAEKLVQEKENEIKQLHTNMISLENRIQKLNELKSDKGDIQERYESLKEEFNSLSERFDETYDARIKAEEQGLHLVEMVKEQETLLLDQNAQLIHFQQNQELLEVEVQKVKNSLEESENRLKTAQQHLGKKVKEVTILNEKVEELQNFLFENQQQLDQAKNQISHLQISLENTQKQEKKLQDQLHECIKNTENQVAKWEEKYFKMYDKWQESETRNRELKKVEERYNQMQNFITNLGSFMGSTKEASNHLQYENRPFDSFLEESRENIKKDVSTEDRFDLFGPKFNPTNYQ